MDFFRRGGVVVVVAFSRKGGKKKKKILCFAIIASDRFFDFSYPIYRYDSFRILSFFFFFFFDHFRHPRSKYL